MLFLSINFFFVQIPYIYAIAKLSKFLHTAIILKFKNDNIDHHIYMPFINTCLYL